MRGNLKLFMFRTLSGVVAMAFSLGGLDAMAQSAATKKETGPVLKYEQFRRRVEFKVADKRENQITGLQRLLKLGMEIDDNIP